MFKGAAALMNLRMYKNRHSYLDSHADFKLGNYQLKNHFLFYCIASKKVIEYPGYPERDSFLDIQ